MLEDKAIEIESYYLTDRPGILRMTIYVDTLNDGFRRDAVIPAIAKGIINHVEQVEAEKRQSPLKRLDERP